jgi:hypothetical protein
LRIDASCWELLGCSTTFLGHALNNSLKAYKQSTEPSEFRTDVKEALTSFVAFAVSAFLALLKTGKRNATVMQQNDPSFSGPASTTERNSLGGGPEPADDDEHDRDA